MRYLRITKQKHGFNVCLIEKNLIGYGNTLENLGIVYSKIDIDDVRHQKYLDNEDIEKCNGLLQDSINEIENIVSKINNENKSTCLHVKKQDILEFSDRFSGKIKINKIYNNLLNNGAKEGKNIQYITENNVLKINNGVIQKDVVLTLNPYEFVQELIHMLSKLENVEIYENTRAEIIHSLKDTVEVTTHNKFIIKADKCIIATTDAVKKYFKDIDFDTYKRYTIVAEKLEENSSQYVAVDNNLPRHIIRFYNGDMLLSGEETLLKERIIAEDVENKNMEGKYKRLFNYLQNVCKSAKVPKIKNCFCSVEIKTKDGLPLIDEIQGLPNVYCNLALGKNTIAYSCIGAKMLQNICKDYYTKNMYLFRADR